jgi:WD40 repeat protein
MADGSAYSTALVNRLEAEGYEVFLDRTDYASGDDWKQIGAWTLRRTSQLILVGSPAALLSDPVIREVEIFQGTGRRIVPIDFGGSLEWKESESPLAQYLPAQILRIKEPKAALESGPSDETVATIRQTFNLVRQDKKRLRAMAIIALLLGALAIAAAWFGYSRELQRQRAEEQRDQALTNESLLLADKAREQLKVGKVTTAALLALRGLPQKGERPWVAEAFGALIEALGAPREALILRGHDGELDSADFSPDGRRVLTASRDNTARLWDAATGKEVVILRGHQAHIYSAVFSPDGARVLTASDDGTARLWDPATGKEIAVLHGGRSEPGLAFLDKFGETPVTSAKFSPDGRYVLTLSGPFPRLWDAATGKEIAILRAHYPHTVAHAEFSSDGARVFTVPGDKNHRIKLSDYTALISDVATGKVVAILAGHKEDVNSAVFSRDGMRVVTASDDKTARIWNAVTGEIIAVLKGHDKRVNLARFSPDGTLVITVSDDKTARLWDAATGNEISILRGHEGEVTSVAFSPDGKLVVTAGKDTAIRLWETASGKEIAIFNGHDKWVNSAVFSPDGKHLLTASEDKTARLWDVAPPKRSIILRGHDDFLTSTAFNPDGAQALTGSWDGTARLWNAMTGTQIAILRGHSDTVMSAVFSPDGRKVLTASMDGNARLWDTATGKAISDLSILRTDQNDIQMMTKAVFSPSGTRILTSSTEGIARLWDTATGKEIGVPSGA